MPIPRYAARTDANKLAIVSALRSAGCSVYDLREPVDLLVGVAGQTVLVEIKDGSKSPSRRKLTPAQAEFMAGWLGGPVAVIDGVEAALRMAQAVKAWAVEVEIQPSPSTQSQRT